MGPREGALIDPATRRGLRELLGERVRFDEPMARHTSLRVGGPAEAFARPGSRSELAALLAHCRIHSLPCRIVGRGFNTLVADGGVAGVAISLQELRGLRCDTDGRVSAEAGVSHATLTRFCAARALGGLEFGVGIPGSVGGWLKMNAGTAQREVREVVERIEFMDPATGHCTTVEAAELRWRYRALDNDGVILSGTFATRPGDAQAIRARMAHELERRHATQPVTEPSCGSVFKNPPGDYAGRLIEAAGLKGAVAGGAQISELHANFIVNRGRARAADVWALIERARGEVSRRFDRELELEVHVLGDTP